MPKHVVNIQNFPFLVNFDLDLDLYAKPKVLVVLPNESESPI